MPSPSFRRLLLPALLVIGTGLSAQQRDRELSLQAAVTYANGRLVPESLQALQWIPGGTELSFVKDDVLMSIGVGKRADRPLLTLAQLIEQLPEAEHPKRFPAITWTGPQRFQFQAGQRIHTYDLSTGRSEPGLTLPVTAEREDLAPTHDKVAYTEGDNLYFLDNGPLGPQPLSTDGTDGLVYGRSVHRDEYGIHQGTFWSPDGGKLAFYRMDERMVTPYDLEDIGTRPSTFNTIRYPMAGQAGHEVSIGVYDGRTGNTVFLRTTGAPDDYLTNIGWTPDGKQLTVIHLDRATQHLRVVLYDALTGQPLSTLLEERDDKWLEPQDPVTFLKTRPDQFIHFSPRDGWRHLYLYSTTKGLIRQLTKGSWVVQRIIGTDPKERYLWVEGTGSQTPEDPRGALESHIYRVDLTKGTTTRLTKEPGVHHGELNDQGTLLIDTWSSTTVPGRTELIDAASGAAVRTLLDSPDPYATIQVGQVELLTILGEGGDRLNARIIKPSTFDPTRRYPVIVYLYNGPHAQMVMNRHLGGAQPWMLHAAERGYLVFTVDGHGTDNRGRAFEQVIHRQLGITEVKDQLLGVEYLKSLPYVDPERLGVHGWSYGGHMTTALMLRSPKTFRVGVAGGPVMDWSMYEVMYTERYMDTPAENPEGYAATRLNDRCGELEGELLIIHGLIDDVVLPQHSYSFLKDCVSKGEQVEFFVYPGHPHNVRGRDRVHLMTKVLDRFDRSLLAP